MSTHPNASPALPDALRAGLVGSVAMTIAHESARRVFPKSPRLDTLGRRALARLIRAAGSNPPGGAELQAVALVGDVASNAALFAAGVLAGPGGSAPVRGAAVGAAAGVLTLALPPHLGIGRRPGRLPAATRWATVALYAGGGLATGLAYRSRRGRGAGGS